MFRLMTLLVASQGMTYILLSWLNRKKLVELMNDWVQLRREMSKKLLGAGDNTETQETSNGRWLKRYAMASFSVIFVSINGTCGYIFIWLSPEHPDHILEVSFLTLMACYLGFSGALSDAKVVLMLKELRGSFSRVRQQQCSAGANVGT